MSSSHRIGARAASGPDFLFSFRGSTQTPTFLGSTLDSTSWQLPTRNYSFGCEYLPSLKHPTARFLFVWASTFLANGIAFGLYFTYLYADYLHPLASRCRYCRYRQANAPSETLVSIILFKQSNTRAIKLCYVFISTNNDDPSFSKEN